MTNRRRGGVFLILVPGLLLLAGLLLERAESLFALRVSIQRTPSSFASSLAVDQREVSDGLPILSVYADRERLHNPVDGLVTHPRRSGRQAETPAAMSYFDQGRLVFAGTVGLRVHGGNRLTSAAEPSFRLHFRKNYGIRQFVAGELFDGQSDPLTRVVVHRDRRQDKQGRSWHLVAPLAYDIARQIGAKTPGTHPVRFFLNGQFQGVYVLTDHLRSDYMNAHYGHENFLRADTEMEEALRAVIAGISPLSVAEVDELIDVESLTRWFVSVVFCATSDPFDAVMFRDRTQPDARWFWINWDMDHSFMDRRGSATTLWAHDTFASTLNQEALESEVLTRLIVEDQTFREYVTRVFTDVLNHRVTLEFLRERFDYYRNIAHRYGVKDPAYLDELGAFLLQRSAEVRRLLSLHLNLGPSHQLEIEDINGGGVDVDGYRKTAAYTGHYFADMDVTIALPEPRSDFSHWLVNGQPIPTPTLRHRVESDVLVTPVFLGSD